MTTADLQTWCRNEWERLLAGAAGIACAGTLIATAVTAAGWYRTTAPPPVREIPARSMFAESAFAFTSPQSPDADLGSDHAFSVKPPKAWGRSPVAQQPNPRPVAATREIAMEDLLAQLRAAIPGSLKTARLVDPPAAPEPTPEPIAVQPPRPQRPPQFITYQGQIRTAEGRQMALVTVEDGDKRASAYVTAGSALADNAVTVLQFDDQGIRCRTSAGATLTIPIGSKRQIQ